MKYNPYAAADKKEVEELALIEKGWHRAFAWNPVKISHREVRWLEFVERRLVVIETMIHRWVKFEYRAIEKEELK